MDRLASRPSSKRPRRTGGTALTLLSSPFNVEAIQHLAQESLPLQELMRLLGFPPRSTARLYLQTLTELGVVERHARSQFPTFVDYELTAAGRALLAVGMVLQGWLARSPAGPMELGSTAAKSAVKALVEGWGSNIIRALVTRPLALTELDSLIPRISYPSLERRLTAMRQVGLLHEHRHPGRASPYEVTDWLREGVAPVVAASGWERRFTPDQTPELRRLDVEAGFLLAVPLVELPGTVSGKCRLAVEVHDGSGPLFAGVRVTIERGSVTSCVPSLESEAEAWAAGTPLAWLAGLQGAPADLELGGNTRLVRPLLEALAQAAGGPH